MNGDIRNNQMINLKTDRGNGEDGETQSREARGFGDIDS